MPNPLRRILSSLRRRRDAAIIRWFTHLYYFGSGAPAPWQQTTWLGAPAQKCPLDLWIYQEILAAVRPDLILETGTYDGGSALFLSSMCDLLGNGQVVTIDIEPRPNRPQHPRLTYITSSSTAPDLHARLQREFLPGKNRVLVILDSDHSQAHVREELRLFAPYVTPGSYLIVEDSCVNGHPVLRAHGPGPMEAINEFLPAHPEFVIDPEKEKFLLTFNPRGYLRRNG